MGIEKAPHRGIGWTAADWLSGTIMGMVDEPSAVRVDIEEQAGGVLFRVKVAPGDLGKVIGKQGRTARALRTLLGCRGMTDGAGRYALDLEEGGPR